LGRKEAFGLLSDQNRLPFGRGSYEPQYFRGGVIAETI
jgi:hypothetical protein